MPSAWLAGTQSILVTIPSYAKILGLVCFFNKFPKHKPVINLIEMYYFLFLFLLH